MNEINIKVITLDHGKDLPLPEYGTPESAGLDLVAAIEAPTLIKPSERAIIPTGICLSIPEGYEGQIRPRSGLAAKFGMTVLNSPGTIDADYQGEILVIMINLGQDPFEVTRGMRIAQIIFAPFTRARLASVTEFTTQTLRGENRFGSTGLHAKVL